MKLLIIRHADPDYSIDSITEKGRVEAECLAEKLLNEKMDYIYCSPLGRAQDTALYTLNKTGRKLDGTLEWLKEFSPQIIRPDSDEPEVAWDWLPGDWTREESFYKKDEWYLQKAMANGNVEAEYKRVIKEFDALLAKHGYVRQENTYYPQKPNDDVIVLFCHFGLECVLLSHLLGVSPMILWHGFCAAPTSVTTAITEERREGTALFRISSFGDISHLYAKGEKPAFAARFCEMYSNMDERHD